MLTAQRGRPDEAIALIGAAVAEAPDDAIFHANLGRARKAAGQQTEALASFDCSIALGSTDPGVFNDLVGNLLRDLQRPQAALDSLDAAHRTAPGLRRGGAFNNRGNALLDLGRHQEALASYAQAIALRPDYAEAFSNRGNALLDLERYQEALASYDQAIALRRDYADAVANRGAALGVLGQHLAALQSYVQALALRPDHPAARFGRAGCLLKMGDLARGWAEFEWRWQMPALAMRAPRFARPPWLGRRAACRQHCSAARRTGVRRYCCSSRSLCNVGRRAWRTRGAWGRRGR